MSLDSLVKAARAEAERRWPSAMQRVPTLTSANRQDRRIGFELGAKWTHAHLAAQEPTDAEVRAAKVALIQDEYRVAPGYELVMIRQMGREEEYDRRARAVLSAARTVQQDEEGRNG